MLSLLMDIFTKHCSWFPLYSQAYVSVFFLTFFKWDLVSSDSHSFVGITKYFHSWASIKTCPFCIAHFSLRPYFSLVLRNNPLLFLYFLLSILSVFRILINERWPPWIKPLCDFPHVLSLCLFELCSETFPWIFF